MNIVMMLRQNRAMFNVIAHKYERRVYSYSWVSAHILWNHTLCASFLPIGVRFICVNRVHAVELLTAVNGHCSLSKGAINSGCHSENAVFATQT